MRTSYGVQRRTQASRPATGQRQACASSRFVPGPGRRKRHSPAPCQATASRLSRAALDGRRRDRSARHRAPCRGSGAAHRAATARTDAGSSARSPGKRKRTPRLRRPASSRPSAPSTSVSSAPSSGAPRRRRLSADRPYTCAARPRSGSRPGARAAAPRAPVLSCRPRACEGRGCGAPGCGAPGCGAGARGRALSGAPHRQSRYAPLEARCDDAAQRLHALRMPGAHRQRAPPGPARVAVHDDLRVQLYADAGV